MQGAQSGATIWWADTIRASLAGMKHASSLALAAAVFLAMSPANAAQDAPSGEPSPGEIVAGSVASDWARIDADDLLVMTLAPDRDGNARQVVIQLMPPPFSQGWVENIRTLARAGWYDGVSINRVQDNYVVQWGDPNVDNPEAEGEAKPLPEGLKVLSQDEYVVSWESPGGSQLVKSQRKFSDELAKAISAFPENLTYDPVHNRSEIKGRYAQDSYARWTSFFGGWPFAGAQSSFWPVHCYGMVGVGRGYSPDTGSGAELYTVIGHAPRHLDRNIALVGRVVEGIEHLSSLPRGKGALGFYQDADRRVPIASVRLASDLPPSQRPSFEYLSTDSETFARYAEARANRRDPFFIEPAGGADVCNMPVPVRRIAEG